MTSTQQSNVITLKGSAAIVSEFFYFGINNILYQRGVYPPEMFKQVKKYGLTTLVITNEKISEYLNKDVLPQLTEWIEQGKAKRVVVVIKEVDSNETLERWQFQINCDQTTGSSVGAGDAPKSSKDIAKINAEIRSVIRQITATVTFLPLLEAPCCFDLLFYTKKDTEAPDNWEDSNACIIENGEEVQLRSFTTKIHKVDGSVSYKF